MNHFIEDENVFMSHRHSLDKIVFIIDTNYSPNYTDI